MFVFTSVQAGADREVFKKELQNIMATNRSNPISTTENGTPQLKSQSLQRTAATATSSVSRATSVSSNDRMSTAPSGPIEDFHIRKKVLMRSPELATLHRELVMTGQITESEFWEGREVCTLALLR